MSSQSEAHSCFSGSVQSPDSWDDTLSLDCSGRFSDCEWDDISLEQPKALALDSAGESEPLVGNAPLMERCRRAAEQLGVDWPSSTPHRCSSRFGGRFLPSIPAAGKHRLPLFKDFASELKATCDSPHSARKARLWRVHEFRGYGGIEGMEARLHTADAWKAGELLNSRG